MARLIDADKLKEAISKSTCHWTEHMWKKVVCDVIDNQPTAYDVEKVVAGLEEKSADIPIQYENNYEQGFDDGVNCSIDIVRKGGIDG